MTAMLPVPFNDLRAAYLALQQEIDAAVTAALDSGWYIHGRQVAAFEAEFAAFTHTAGCVGVNSGTDALVLALRACQIGPGDEAGRHPEQEGRSGDRSHGIPAPHFRGESPQSFRASF